MHMPLGSWKVCYQVEEAPLDPFEMNEADGPEIAPQSGEGRNDDGVLHRLWARSEDGVLEALT